MSLDETVRPAAIAMTPTPRTTSPGARLLVAALVSLVALAAGGCRRHDDRKPAVESQPSDVALPGAEPFDLELAARLELAVAQRGPSYQPRTRHRGANGSPVYTNRLVLESSPYLQQHAHNPVNWYPWGAEAFATAMRLGRPVLLSVGYSTCHWCHVMEEESFEDEEIARYINANYVAIKVDREELPDVDSIYMAAVQRITGGGGWPMTVWLTPDRKPFYGGTYFPPRAGARGAHIGFLEILQKLAGEYRDNRDGMVAIGDQLAQMIQRMMAPPPGTTLDRATAARALANAADMYAARFDPAQGGTTGQPKFPSSMPVRFLLRYHRRTNEQKFLDMAVLTLEKMAAGGMYDHAGGGFHRYATDERWLVPHFEKMLYDNALLALAYMEGYQATGRAEFAEVAREILRYVQRDMTSPQGGFYSATDADSKNALGHAEEGAFFTWTPAELASALDPRSHALAMAYFGVSEAGNFDGRNVLHTPRPLAQVAAELDMDVAGARDRIAQIKDTLYQARKKRSPPLRDEKILSAWNGLMISALARAAMALGPGEGDYLAQARRAAEFVLARMRSQTGLWRSHVDGQARVPGYLDDHAFFIAGLMDLFEATGESRYLDEAVALDRVLARRFEDVESGGFFMASAEHDALLAREKPSRDGAIPSGNSIAAMNLLRLYELTTEPSYLARAEKLFEEMSAVLLGNPLALSEMLLALDFWTDASKQIVIVTPSSRAEAQPFLAVLSRAFVPSAVVVVVTEAEAMGALAGQVPVIREKTAQRGQTTAYVCEQQRCELPTRDPQKFREQVVKAAPLRRD
jgi:hypothetical protein